MAPGKRAFALVLLASLWLGSGAALAVGQQKGISNKQASGSDGCAAGMNEGQCAAGDPGQQPVVASPPKALPAMSEPVRAVPSAESGPATPADGRSAARTGDPRPTAAPPVDQGAPIVGNPSDQSVVDLDAKPKPVIQELTSGRSATQAPPPPPADLQDLLDQSWLAVLAIVALGACILLSIAFLIGWRKQRALATQVRNAERVLAEEFGSPQVKLPQAAQYIRKFKSSAAEMVLEQERKIKELQAAPSASADSSLSTALSIACKEAALAFDALADDKDYRDLAATLPIEQSYHKLDRLLQDDVAARARDCDLWPALTRGDLDLPITLPALLEAYCPGEGAWYRATRAAAAVDALLRAALAKSAIEIFVVRPLTRVRSRASDASAFDVRGIRRLGRAKAAVSKVAANLQPGEDLVVDCSAPGYVAAGRGSSPPRLTYYNPSAW